jgi:4-alpha-glucanotransferase
VQVSYIDATKRRRRASPEGLLAVLEILGAPVRSMADVPNAIGERERALVTRPLEPVIVAWGDRAAMFDVTLPEGAIDGLLMEVTLEDGEAWPLPHRALTADHWKQVEVGGSPFVRRGFLLEGLPVGYHSVEVRSGAVRGSAVVMSAPPRCRAVERREWGAFLPLYALRSARNWGCGDFTDLEELFSWVQGLGGATVGTLPLLAAFLDEPFDPSPYSPVSRLFWNEIFIDVDRVPELERSEQARHLITSPGYRSKIEAARRAGLVNYRAVAALKRRALAHLARAFDSAPSVRRDELERHASSLPDLDDYATFRATAERHRAGWPEWPPELRDRSAPLAEVDPEIRQYHRYVQLLAEEQLASSTPRSEPGRGLYLDLPLGVNPGGYDTWRYQDGFALRASAGAPPDVFFTKGQDWGFPPMHPEGARADGYGYHRSVVRNLLRHAGALRIDHVMGLHRMFWVPPGLDPRFGVYVRYRAQELYAILALESHRAGAAIVGEDLGTVPAYVPSAMARHGILRSYVLQLETLGRATLRQPSSGSLGSLNTHDLPPFRGYWDGLDIEDRMAQGQLDEKEARAERAERSRQRGVLSTALGEAGFLRGRDPSAVAHAGLRYLAASPARMMVVNLEDLWGETEPQNRPGTGAEQPNWRRKAAQAMDRVRSDPFVAGTLEEIDRLRRGQGQPGAST